MPSDLEANKVNTLNTKMNTTECLILEFLQNRPEGDWWYSPKVLASKGCLDIPYGTVRRVLRKLLKKGLVVNDKKGIVSFYAAAKHWTGDFNRLIKTYGAKKKWHIHGLTMKLEAEDIGLNTFPFYPVQKVPHGGVGKVVREHYGVAERGLTSLQLSKGTMTVWCGCTLEPMDYDRFVLWLKGLDTWLMCHGWARIEGNLRHWKVVQLGLNDDFTAARVDRGICVTLQGFQGFLARVYDKPELGENVVRCETHIREEKALEMVLDSLGGGMKQAQVMGSLEHFAESLNTTNVRQGDIVRAIGKLNDRVSSLESKANELLENPVVSAGLEQVLERQNRNIVGVMATVSDLSAAFFEVKSVLLQLVELEKMRVQAQSSSEENPVKSLPKHYPKDVGVV